MIPADLAARLRMLTEASFFQTDQPVHELNRAREIPADLPEFSPGQRLTATIERPLPDSQFRALVAGKTVTLALPTDVDADLVQPGRTLALEVTRSTPRAIHAQLVAPQAEAPQPPALSQTGRLISVLLTGQPSTTPVALAAGKPLLPAPPTSGAPLVPALRTALSQSGLFYESHQAQWISGQVTTQALRQEPQGQVPPTPPPPATTSIVAEAGRPDVAILRDTTAPPPPAVPPTAQPAEGTPRQALQPQDARLEAGASPELARGTPTATGSAIPERILQVVSQQLDALATQQFVWQGQVWPGQTMEWQIEDPTGGRGEGVENQNWNTTLRLTLPRLGTVEARLQLTPSGVAVRLLAADHATQSALTAASTALAQQLDAAQVPLMALTVEPGDGGT